MEQKNEQWLVSAEELLAMPPQPMTLDAVFMARDYRDVFCVLDKAGGKQHGND